MSILGAFGLGLVAGWLACSPLMDAGRSRRLDWVIKLSIYAAALGGSSAGLSFFYAGISGLILAVLGVGVGLLLRLLFELWAFRQRGQA